MKRVVFYSLLGLLLAVSTAGAGGEIHGTIETRDGRTLTGPIRWDVNENFWGDRLDAMKTERLGARTEEDGFRFSLFGWEIVNASKDHGGGRSISIPFGHISSIEPLSGQEALVTLKNGEELEFRAGSTDIGSGMRGLVIEDAKSGAQDISWRNMTRVAFSEGSGGGRDAERLYGTVVTASGSLTGFIVWDRDESMLEDILNGEDQGNRDHEIPFRDIAAIERLERGSLVKLKNGESLQLHGTNDVAAGHRGILVAIKDVGTAEIDWRNVNKVNFAEPPASATYDRFDGGRRLHGKVNSSGDVSYSGLIVWDLDEAYSWETLDGSIDGIDYAVDFANIKSITPQGYASSEVLLRNGEILLLSGTNDVNGSNDGVQVIPDREEADSQTTIQIILEWDELRSVELD
jgi:hypothetical protein